MTALENAVTGIYAIIRAHDGATYIGQAKNCRTRFNHHRHHLRAGTHTNPRLQHAWSAHGESAFRFLVIEKCDESSLTAREQFHFDAAKAAGLNTFNAGDITECPNRGRKLSPLTEDHKKKISEKLRGKVRTPEHCAAIGQSQKGKITSAEAKAKMRLAKLGKKQTLEHIANAAQTRIGKKHSPSHIRNAVQARVRAMIGKSISSDTREKLRIAATGRALSDAAKEKCRQASLNYWASVKVNGVSA